MEFNNIENIFLGFDEWAYDIEQEYENNKYISPKKKRQYINICDTRDKYYDRYVKRMYGGWVSIPKSCSKRFIPTPPPKQPKPYK